MPTAKVRSPGRAAAAPTRELILDTAERLFAAHGVDGVAVRDLAREMGITASSLYNHFPGKQALYQAVLERGLGPILEAVAAAWADGVRPDRVQATLAALTSHLVRHPHLAGLLQRALLEDSPTVRTLIETWVASLYREGVAVVRAAARDAGWEAADLMTVDIGGTSADIGVVRNGRPVLSSEEHVAEFPVQGAKYPLRGDLHTRTVNHTIAIFSRAKASLMATERSLRS